MAQEGDVVMKQPMWQPGEVAYSNNPQMQMSPPPFNAVGPVSTVVTTQPTNTTIIMTQSDFRHPRGIPRDWSTPLCGCFEDCIGCLCAFCFFPCYECHVASKMGENCCMPFCVPHATLVMRAHVRGRHNIQGSLINDCCTTVCCSQCALAQLSREIDNMQSGRAAP